MPGKNNKWLTDGISYADTYLKGADVIVPERRRVQKLIIDLFGYHFKNPQNLNIFDLGCGDGIMTGLIRDKYPDNGFFLMDGSADMIKKAEENVSGKNVYFIHQTFEDYINAPIDKQKYDFVHSSNAIHHLDLHMKERLFLKIYDELRTNGLFLNFDPIKPASDICEQWQFKMWIDWINETLSKNNRKDETGEHNNLPSIYKNKEENKPDTLQDQLGVLINSGFTDVDCFYKYGIFALFGGTKEA